MRHRMMDEHDMVRVNGFSFCAKPSSLQKLQKKIAMMLVLVMVFCMTVGVIPFVPSDVYAAEFEEIDVSNTTDRSGSGWSYSEGKYTILSADYSYKFTGTGSTYIEISSGLSDPVSITLDGANITSYWANTISIPSGVTVDLVLVNDNYLTASSANVAAIHVPTNAVLNISGTGSLSASSSSNAAGIGGAASQHYGEININSGSITAYGSGGGAGIGGAGGSSPGTGGTITINGGTVVATGGDKGGAGIGGGAGGNYDSFGNIRFPGAAGGTIIINGGDVTATGGSMGGAGIGGGYGGRGSGEYGSGSGGDGGTISIGGGTVTATGGTGAAGIGGGGGKSTTGGAGGTVTVSGGDVSATGGTGAAGIGGGGGDSTGGDGGTVSISGGTVTASGGAAPEGSGVKGFDIGSGGGATSNGASSGSLSMVGGTITFAQNGTDVSDPEIEDCVITGDGAGGSVEAGSYNETGSINKEITGYTALNGITLAEDGHLVTLDRLIASGKLPTTVTVTDGTTPAAAAITSWSGTYDGETIGTYTLTPTWTMPNGYADVFVPIISVTQSVVVDVIQSPFSYTAGVDSSSVTFPNANVGYGSQSDKVITITNTGSGQITGLNAVLGSSDFEISTALSATTINAGDTATLSVRPITGKAVDTYTDTLTITADHGISLTVSLSFTVNKASQTDFAIDHSGSVTYSGNTIQLSTTGGNGDGAVTYALTMGKTSCGTVTSTGAVTLSGVGTVYVTATKAATATYLEATASIEISVEQATPTLSFAASPEDNTAEVGDPVILTATVTVGSGMVTPTGSVAFYQDGDLLGTITLSSGSAAYQINDLGYAIHDFTAAYSGDANYVTASAVIDDYNLPKLSQSTVSVVDPGTITYGDTGLKLTISGGSGDGDVIFSVPVNEYLDVASDGTLTIKAASGGNSVAVSVYKEGNAMYLPSNTATVTLSVERLAISVPSANTSLTYNGSSQTGVSGGTGYTISDNSATNAGDYTATVTPGSNYQWSSGENTTAARSISWSIGRLGISAPSADTSLTYNGSSQTGVSAGTGYTISDNSATNAGDYTATVTPGSNYQWNSGENVTAARSISWSIGRLGISVPSANTSLTYNGSSQTGVSAGTGYTISGNSATNAGDYTATVTPGSNYQWNSGENVTAARIISWSIGRLGIAKPTLSTSTLTYNGATQTILTDGTGYTVTGNTEEDADDYAVTVQLNSNYKWSDNSTGNLSLAWEIVPYAITVTAEDKSKEYGTADPTLTYTVYPALFAGDMLTGSLKYTGSAVGTYEIIENVPFSNPNYAITFVSGEMTILQVYKEITGFTALSTITLDADEFLLNFDLLRASGKLPTSVTVTDGTTPVEASITNWSGTYDGETLGTYTLTPTWTMPSEYADDIAPINVTQSVVVAVVQKPISYTATLSHEAVTFSNAIIGYETPNATEITITNTGTGQITGLNAALSTSDFEISTALSASTINAGATATLSVRPITGKAVNTYTDTLTITADHGISLTVSLTFTVNKASQTTLSFVDPGTLTYGDSDKQLPITGGSGDGDAIFSVPVNEYLDVASDGTLTIKAASDGNSVTVSVYKEGNAMYLPSNTATITLSVERLAISVPTANTSLTYDGSSQTGVSTGTGYTVSGNSATNAGNYTATVTPGSNYQWDSGENVTAARSISWSIGRLGISVPSANTSLTYNGSSQTGVSAGNGYTISGNSATNAGDYTATVTPGSNYQWNSGENVTAVRSISWSIGRLGIAKPTLSSSTLTYNGATQTILSDGTGYTVTGNTEEDADDYTVTVQLNSNYRWLDNSTGNLSLAWEIAPYAITVTAEDNSKEYGAADPTLTYTVSPALFAGDSLAGSLKYTGSAVGTYEIVENVPFSNPNYAITFVSGEMTILQVYKEITGFTPLSTITLNADEHLLDFDLLRASGKLPTSVTVTDGTSPVEASITNWSGAYDGETLGTYTLTPTWTMPSEYADDIAPINVTQSVVVAVVQKPISYTATLSHEAVTFSNAIIGYGTQNATEITITNTGTGQITGLNAALSTSDFEISTALSATTINAGATATLSVRPITGKTVNTYTDTLTITADHGISLTVSLSFTVNKASQTTLSLVDPGTLTYGDTGMQLAISGGSGDGDVIFSVPENEYLDVASDGSLTIKAASDGNSVTVSVYKEGNATYLPSNTATLSLVVERLAISVPSANTSLTYNGSSQTGVSTGTGYTVSGNSATNAGDYTATVTPDSNYQWDSGENVTAARNIVWSIGRLGIPVPSANTSLTYDGSSQTGVSTGTGYTVSGNSATNAGDYTATVTPGSNYQWDSGENVTAARNIVWSIGRLGIPVPTANTSLTYNGNSQIGVNAGTGYTIVGNSAINAGNHTATVTPDSNYQWDSGENVTAARSISWSIGRLGIAKPTLSTNALTYNGATQTILSDGTGYTVSGNTGEDADDYTVTVQLNSNYKWADNTTGNLELAWTIIRCPITVTAQDKSKYYGEKDPTLTYTVTPTLFAGDTLTGSLQYIGSNVGTYTIVQNVPFAHPNYTVTFVSGKMHILQIPTNEQVIDLVDQFPQNETTQFFADQVASASKMYDALSDVEKSQIPQSIKDALLAAQAKAAIVNHQDTEGWVIGDIPWNVRLSLDLIPNENVSKANFETELPTDKELVVLFEIKLINTMNRENYVIPQGESVTITLHVSLLDPTGAVILHQKHDGTIEVLEAVVTKDTVTFTASSFSLYGVAVEKDVPQNPPVQSDEPTVSVKPSEPIVVPTAPKTEMQDKQFLLGIGIGVISLLLLVAVVGILIRRRKDDEL